MDWLRVLGDAICYSKEVMITGLCVGRTLYVARKQREMKSGAHSVRGMVLATVEVGFLSSVSSV